MRARLLDPTVHFAVLVGAWVLTRVLLLILTRSPALYPAQNDPLEMGLFAGWGSAFAGTAGPDTTVPLRDGPWEYPAGAAAVIAAPAVLRGAPYVLGFVGQMLLWDLAGFLLLVLLGMRRGGSLAGAWLWLAAVPLLGPVALGRFDLVPTVLAVAGLACAAAAPLAAGVLLGAGAVVKAWPALLVLLVLPLLRAWGARVRVVLGAAAVGVVTALAVTAYGGAGQLLSFLSYQRDRGLEVESAPALPLMLARAYGDTRMTVGFAFGSVQVDGPWASTMLLLANAGLALTLLSAAVLTWRARHAEPARAAPVLAAVLTSGFLLWDKALSPQYPIWLAGLVALSLARRDSPLRSTVLPLAGVLLATQAVYPLAFVDLVDAAQRAPVLVLALRDLLLVVVLALSARAAWRLGRWTAPPAAPPDLQPTARCVPTATG